MVERGLGGISIARTWNQASQLVDRALALNPGSADAQRARGAIDGVRRRQEEERQRERLVAAALVRARQSLSSGQLETAIRAAGEILIQDPTHQEAHELTREALVCSRSAASARRTTKRPMRP